jgi:hypothetical protein
MATASSKRSRPWRSSRSASSSASGVESGSALTDHTPKRLHAEYDSAVHNGFVALEQIAHAHWHLHELSKRDEEERDAAELNEQAGMYAYYAPRLWKAYQARHGQATNYYFATELPAIVVLTDRDELDFFCPPKTLLELAPQFETTLWSCIAQSPEIAQVLWTEQSKKILLRQLYWLLVYLVSVLESQAKSTTITSTTSRANSPMSLLNEDSKKQLETNVEPSDDHDHFDTASVDRVKVALDYADQHLEEVCVSLDEYARRDAQQRYLFGAFMVAYTFFLILLAGAAGLFDFFGEDMAIILVAFGSGSIGALVSVMLRFMNQPLRIDYHAGKSLMFVAGVFRPLIGALFGLIFYVLLNAGILQEFTIPHDTDKFLYFVAAITFLAGFSERRTQDLLVRVSPLVGDNRASEPVSPSPRRRPKRQQAN